MPVKTLTVIIPSRFQPQQLLFLDRAVQSLKKQTVINDYELTVIVGVDKGGLLEKSMSESMGVKCVESQKASQASALNAAIDCVDTEFVAFLEDDDEWHVKYLEAATQAMAFAPFVSSTQIEYNENNVLLRINDFPTPSGWFMRTDVLKKVGNFNEEYRFHLDNEWLGRIADANIPRIHMVEFTAPVDIRYISGVRPWLANVLKNSKGLVRLARHSEFIPLVRRLRHSEAGMEKIANSPEHRAVSQNECRCLVECFGRIPW